jgi:hypothetical protein
MFEQVVIRVRGQYPATFPKPHDAEQIRPGCTIYHGPAVLAGSLGEFMGMSWGGEPTLLGSFYAAVAPDDPDAAELRAENLAAGAVVLEYVTDDQVREAVTAHIRAAYAPDDAKFLLQGIPDADAFWGWYVREGMHYRREPMPA